MVSTDKTGVRVEVLIGLFDGQWGEVTDEVRGIVGKHMDSGTLSCDYIRRDFVIDCKDEDEAMTWVKKIGKRLNEKYGYQDIGERKDGCVLKGNVGFRFLFNNKE